MIALIAYIQRLGTDISRPDPVAPAPQHNEAAPEGTATPTAEKAANSAPTVPQSPLAIVTEE